jgi:hypothetical protein
VHKGRKQVVFEWDGDELRKVRLAVRRKAAVAARNGAVKTAAAKASASR